MFRNIIESLILIETTRYKCTLLCFKEYTIINTYDNQCTNNSGTFYFYKVPKKNTAILMWSSCMSTEDRDRLNGQERLQIKKNKKIKNKK